MSVLMHTLHVELGDRSYPVYIGRDLLSDHDLLAQHVRGSQVVLVSNDTVAPLYMDRGAVEDPVDAGTHLRSGVGPQP